MSIRVGVHFDEAIDKSDPAKIVNLSQAFFVRNLYSSIFEYDDSAQIVTGLAESFYWAGNELYIRFGDKAHTRSGYRVGAKDAEMSLKRLIILSGNTHGDISKFVCGSSDILKLMDACPGIRVEGDNLILKVNSISQHEGLMTLLCSVDFRVIPLTAIDPLTLRIVDFTETSGPYYASSIDLTEAVLQKNSVNYLLTSESPEKVYLVSTKNHDAATMFIENKIDLIPTFVPISSGDVQRVAESSRKSSIFKTHNIRIGMWLFSERAQKDFSARQRFFIAKKLLPLLRGSQMPFGSPTSQFFQDFGEGYLDSESLKELEVLRKADYTGGLPRKVSVAVNSQLEESSIEFFRNNDEFEKVKVAKHPINLLPGERPDVYYSIADVAYKSNYSMLSYYIGVGAFGIFGSAAQNFLEQFSKEYREDRSIKMITELHKNALFECSMYPISVGPYFVVSDASWNIEMNKFFSVTRLWKLRRASGL